MVRWKARRRWGLGTRWRAVVVGLGEGRAAEAEADVGAVFRGRSSTVGSASPKITARIEPRGSAWELGSHGWLARGIHGQICTVGSHRDPTVGARLLQDQKELIRV
ncbi:hypothetical protein GQ457_15G007540 [Hibiscus cannabinus]